MCREARIGRIDSDRRQIKPRKSSESENEKHKKDASERRASGSAVVRLDATLWIFVSLSLDLSTSPCSRRLSFSSPQPLPLPRPPPPPPQVRADLNVPLDKDLKITDDTRIRAAIPTLKYLVDNGAKVLLTSHLGRPKDGPEDKFRLNPVVPRLQELLKGTKVSKVDDCIGDSVAAAAKALGNGE